jgi:hypothetical protein
MKRIDKEYADKMVEDVLIAISKLDDIPSGFAKDSIEVMNNPIDNSVFTGVLLSKARPSLFTDNEIDMKTTILGALQTILAFSKEENKNAEDLDFNKDLLKEFDADDDSKCANSTKLDFALNQFVNAFFEYERLEGKYPELMKMM